jgi:hypothetical protein
MNLTPATSALVRDAIRGLLSQYTDQGLTGVSCIAAGADSIFAETVLDLGGRLEVVIPASDYRDRKLSPEHAARFDRLVNAASKVRVMPYATSSRDAYEAANQALLGLTDRLVAVWDGRAPVDKGGTAAVVASAKSRGIPVDIVWPAGAARA